MKNFIAILSVFALFPIMATSVIIGQILFTLGDVCIYLAKKLVRFNYFLSDLYVFLFG